MSENKVQYAATLPSPHSSDENFHCHDDAVLVDLKIARSAKAKRVLWISVCICLVFMVCEVVGGFWANSLAIVTDAAHLLTDFASMLISLFSLYIAGRKPSQRMSFGFHRAEVLGAFFSVFLIWTGILVILAIMRIVNGNYEVDAPIMAVTAGLGVLVNIVMGGMLYFGGHSHSHSHGGGGHGHAHSNAHAEGAHGHSHNGADDQNINVRAAFIHVLGDLIQSIGVLIAALIIYFKNDWAIVDPICTLMFSVIVLCTTIYILRDAMVVLLEGRPSNINFSQVFTSLEQIPGVRKVHDLRIWALTMDKVDAPVMAVTAGLGVLVNIVMGGMLYFGGHSHSHSHGGGGHGHAHSNAHAEGAHGHSHNGADDQNINVRAAFIHVLGDLIQSIGVLIAALIIYFKNDWAIVDPICTLMFSVIVLCTTIYILRDAVVVLLEGRPSNINFSQVFTSLEQIPGVRKVHDLRIWALTMDKVAISVHLEVEDTSNAQIVLRDTRMMLQKNFGVHESTVQIEGFAGRDDCGRCDVPK